MRKVPARSGARRARPPLQSVAGAPPTPPHQHCGGVKHDARVGKRPADRAGLRPGGAGGLGPGGEARRARRVPVHPGGLPVDVHRTALDDAPVRRLRHRLGVQRALQAADRQRHHGPVGRLRPAHPDGPRLGRAHRARRGRQGRRRHRLDRRHAGALRRHPAGQGVHVDDDQRARRAAAAALPARRRGAGSVRRPADRHDPERRAEGVHRAGHVHLPAEAVAAADRGHLRVLQGRDPEVEHHFDLRLPHGGSRRLTGAGDRLHARRRNRIRAHRGRRRYGCGRFRSAAVVLLRVAHHDPGGGREIPGGPADLGAGDARGVRREESQVADAAFPHPDRGCAAHRAAARGQPGAGRRPGPGGGARRHPVAAHQLLRRGHRAAHRQVGQARAAHPAGAGLRDRRDRHRGPVRGQLRGGEADRRGRGGHRRADGQGRGAGRRRVGDRARLPEGRDRAERVPHRPGDRRGRAGGGRRQPLQARRRGAVRAAAGGPGDRGAAGGQARRATGGPRPGRGGRRPGRAAEGGRGQRQRPLPDEGRAARPRHGRRGVQRAARGVGHLRADRRLLTLRAPRGRGRRAVHRPPRPPRGSALHRQVHQPGRARRRPAWPGTCGLIRVRPS
ncbi:hypothetical protein SCOCK_330084 [Actinacidiphila cocklensis]|uniref:Uncharacterized protein n=1 Tax=Actinacidiphila cocklensis TaxID=887465 RepID=A0A9W4GT98_9ACTN|nr:hypothetical protein SCOCK_330084 [Actinacidiphila cocklensis]